MKQFLIGILICVFTMSTLPTVVDASAGGGMVSIKMNGQKHVISVHIDPEVFASKDAEMLQDLVQAALNDAARKVDEQLASRVGSLTGGLNIPGLT